MSGIKSRQCDAPQFWSSKADRERGTSEGQMVLGYWREERRRSRWDFRISLVILSDSWESFVPQIFPSPDHLNDGGAV